MKDKYKNIYIYIYLEPNLIIQICVLYYINIATYLSLQVICLTRSFIIFFKNKKKKSRSYRYIYTSIGLYERDETRLFAVGHEVHPD